MNIELIYQINLVFREDDYGMRKRTGSQSRNIEELKGLRKSASEIKFTDLELMF